MTRRTSSALVCALLALSSAPRDAHAWCRTTTTQSKFVPSVGKPCNDTGKPLFWASKCVGYSVQQNASVKVDLGTARSLADIAFSEWSKHPCPADPVACTGALGGAPSITATQADLVACNQVQYNDTSGNANAIIFQDTQWPHDPRQIALTTITFVAETGEIYDADLEVNTAQYKIVAAPAPKADEYDLQSILTHEAGHYYGLAHSPATESTMYASYVGGESSKRDLSNDDICGICATYPPARSGECSATPHGGFQSACGEPPPKTSNGCGCEVVGGAGDGSDTRFALAALCVAITARAAARARRRPRSMRAAPRA